MYLMEEGQVNRRRLTLVTGFAKALSKVETVLRLLYTNMCILFIQLILIQSFVQMA